MPRVTSEIGTPAYTPVVPNLPWCSLSSREIIQVRITQFDNALADFLRINVNPSRLSFLLLQTKWGADFSSVNQEDQAYITWALERLELRKNQHHLPEYDAFLEKVAHIYRDACGLIEDALHPLTFIHQQAWMGQTMEDHLYFANNVTLQAHATKEVIGIAVPKIIEQVLDLLEYPGSTEEFRISLLDALRMRLAPPARTWREMLDALIELSREGVSGVLAKRMH